ncbi:oligomeric golgi complex component, COG2-domain-containing protein [Gautieria morchelliformis]|nr:oligomeric golgi complex component, COG2-domain-containing protein [Gautieria morchelliformis]
MSLSFPNGTQLDRISTLIADASSDDHFSEPNADLPIVASLSHNDHYLSSSTFSVEDFLVSRSHTSLPDLRQELRDYLGTLKEELVQLINDDYAAFISLSTDLRGEGARLERLKYPLKGVKREIEASLGQLKLIQETVHQRLEERSALREEKALLHLLLKLSESLTRLESLLSIPPPPKDDNIDTTSHDPNIDMHTNSLQSGSHDERSNTNRVKHLSRVAAEFTQMLYHVEKARSERCAFVDEIQWRVDRIKSTLSSDLDHLFAMTLLSLKSGDSGGKPTPSEHDKARWRSDLKECLRTYDILGGWREAEAVVRREIVKSFIKQTIFSGALSVPHSPLIPRTPFPTRTLTSGQLTPATPYTPFTSRPRKTPFEPQFVSASESHLPLLDDSEDALAALYNKVLRFVERDMKSLMDIAEVFSARHRQPTLPVVAASNGHTVHTDQYPQGEGFEFMSNTVWAEIGRGVMEELGSVVFAAGRPDDFRQHYVTTQNFLAALEFLAPSLHSVESMRAHPVYLTFQRRWQLPVYFQLRWKDIVGKLEDALSSKSDSTIILPKGTASPEFTTSQAAVVFEAIRTCWSQDVYIPEIGHRFWRLTLQILSRYRTWLDANQPPREPSANVVAAIAAEKTGTGAASPSSRATTPIPPSEVPGESTATDDTLLNRSASVIHDLTLLKRKVLEFWLAEISIILPDVEAEDGALPSDALKHALAGITDLIPSFSSHIIAILTRRSCEALVLVRSIPSQYRAMSNKRLPKEPSHFIPDVLRPVKSFLSSIPSGLEQELGPVWATDVFGAVCHRYISYLVAMRKTEESLRRLKKGKTSTFSLFSGSPTANKDQDSKDEERLRVQMVLDVAALGDDARSLHIDVDNYATFRELETMAAHGNAEST